MKPTTLLQTDSALVRIMPLAAGKATAWHHHSQVTDTMVGMSGTVIVEMQNPLEQVQLHPGEHCQVPPGRRHRVRNPAPTPLSYLLVQGVGRYDFIE